MDRLKDLRRLSALVALAFAGLAWFAVVSAPAQERPVIRFASEGARPPFNFLNADSELDGLEIDLAKEICRRLNAECSFVAQDWDDLLPNLRAGQYDAVIAAMEITEERRAKAAFSEPYLRMPSAFVSARRRQIRESTPAGLEGRTIGVAANTPQQTFLEEKYPKSTIKTYDGIEAAILDLAEGRIDVMLGEKDSLVDFLKHRYEAKCCKLLADAPRDPTIFGEGFGIALRPENAGLKARIDAALKQITEDGAYARISAKYFEFNVR